LGLHERARGKRESRYSGRESEIILDLGTGTRLSAGSPGLDHQHIEPLGCAVYRRRQPGGSRADHDDVANPVVVDRLIHPQAGRHLFVARILEDNLPAAEHHGDVLGLDAESLEQLAHRGVRVDVVIDVRKGIAREKLLQPQSVGGVGRSEQNHIAALGRDEFNAPQNKGAHEYLAELGVGLNDGAQIGFGDDQDLAGIADTHAHQAAGAAQRAHLSGEAAGRVQYHHNLSGDARLHDLDAAR
jgi:hypothetical protein